MSRPRDLLLQHLENALRTFGTDLPLPVPARDPARTAPAASTATDDRPKGPLRFGGNRSGDRPQAVPQTRPQSAAKIDAVPTYTPPPALAKKPEAASAGDPAGDLVGAPAGLTNVDDPLAALRGEVMACQQCKLCETRKTVVFGEGHRHPPVLFVGEAPGAVEDRTGRPFVGPAGELLDRIINGGMGLQREDIFIANINKCRPPGNRDPEPTEVAACLPYLRRQVELLQPKVIVALGRIAAHNLLATSEPMRALRGREFAYEGIPVVVTWHPAFLLRDASRKRETWTDIQRVNQLLGRPADPRQG